MHGTLTPTERKSAATRWLETYFASDAGKATIERERKLRTAQSKIISGTSYPACDTFSKAGRP